MKHNDVFTKLLAIAGMVLVWLPLLAPILFAVLGYFARGMLFFDYLMPAELFPLALAGAVLLLWAALRAHDRRKWIGAASAVAIVALILLLLSPGAMPGTWVFTLLIVLLALYATGLAVTGIGGALLVHDLFQRPPAPHAAT